ncbi:endonuclease III [bacterium]|nr:endonuclease III [bacterium]
MTRKKRAEIVARMLEELFPEVPIPLDHRDPFTLLCAVVLSAQCTDARVNTVTPELFRLAPDPASMVALGVERIADIVRPCGLTPMKSKGLHGLSQILIEQHGGQVPESFEALEALPAVGHKTASVVMSQAFGHPAFPVDTHIHRLMHRWGLSSGKSVEQTERDAKVLWPAVLWNKLHLQIIFYGRQYSPARGWNPEEDPIQKALEYRPKAVQNRAATARKRG